MQVRFGTALPGLLLVLAAFSGCFGEDASTSSTTSTTGPTSSGNSTASPTNSTGNTSAPEPPIANFTVAPVNASETNLTAGLDLLFNASASSDPADGNLTFAWDFGDNATGEGVAPNHTFESAGNYTVTLTVTSEASGLSASTNQTLVIEAGAPQIEPRVWTGSTTGVGPPVDFCDSTWVYFDNAIYLGWTYKVETSGFHAQFWNGNDTVIEEGKTEGTVPEGTDNVGACPTGLVANDAAWKITLTPPGYKP